MTKTKTILGPIIFTLAVSLSFVFAQAVDLTGTWKGPTEVPDQGTDEVTLVLQKAEASYTGTITDSLGMVIDAEIEDANFEDNTLTFYFYLVDGQKVFAKLKLEENKLKGHWETEDGTTGDIELEKV